MPKPINQQALDTIRAVLPPEGLRHSRLVIRLHEDGHGEAVIDEIVPLLRAGYLAGQGVYDQNGDYLEARIFKPEDIQV